MELIGLREVTELLQCSRKEATRILNLPGCPVLPRCKKGRFRVPKEAFLAWIAGGCHE